MKDALAQGNSAEEIAQCEKLLDYSKVPLHLLDEANG
jgi:hypothetical protein